MGSRPLEAQFASKVKVWASWLAQHGILVSIMSLNVVVAVTGFGKDVAVATYLGTTRAADTFSASYGIIDSIGTNALGNAANVATAAKLGEVSGVLGRDLYRRVAWQSIGFVSVVGAALAVALFFLRGPLLSMYAVNSSQLVNMVSVYIWLLPLALLHPLFYSIAGVLQAVRRFWTSTAAPAILNLGTLATSVWLIMHGVNRNQGTVAIAASISVGAAVMALVVLVTWRSQETKYKVPSISTSVMDFSVNKLYTDLTSMMLVYALYMMFSQGVGIAERVAANRLSVGSLAAVTYAYRVAQVPNWIFVAAVGSFLIPQVTAQGKLGRVHDLQQTLRRAVGICIMMSLPVAIAFAVLRVPIVRILFQRGAFTQHSVELTATFLGGYTCALVLQGLSTLLFRFTVALGRYIWPSVVVAGAYTLNAAIDIIGTPRFGPLTIGVGAAVGAGICTLFLMFEFYRCTGVTWRVKTTTLARHVVGNAFVLFVSLCSSLVFDEIGPTSELESTVLMLVSFAIIAIGYIIILLYGKVSETDRKLDEMRK